MRKLILLASLPVIAMAQEISPAEYIAENYLSISLTPKHMIVIRNGIRNTRTPADGEIFVKHVCKEIKGKATTLFKCQRGNLTLFEDNLLVELDEKIEQCTKLRGQYEIKAECEKDGKVVLRALEGNAGYQTTWCGQWSCFHDGTQVLLVEVEDTKGLSHFERGQKLKKFTSLDEIAKGFFGLKQTGPVIKKDELHINTQGFEFLFKLANICQNQGGQFYAKGVSLETYLLGALAGSIKERYRQFTGTYFCKGGKEPFTAYMEEKPAPTTQGTLSRINIEIVKTFEEEELQKVRERFLKAYKPAIEKLLAKYPEIAKNEVVKKDLESYIAQETQTPQTPQTQPMPPIAQPSPIQGGPGYEIAQRAAQEGKPITVRDGYTMWTTRIVERDTRGCTRVEVAKINLAAPPGVRTMPETWTYTFCQGQAESIGKPKYFQIPPQAKEMGQQIANFCQRYGSATGKWNDIEINCRALRDKDQCLVEITYFDVINRAFVGSETVNGCR